MVPPLSVSKPFEVIEKKNSSQVGRVQGLTIQQPGNCPRR
jgi:hypothetical protein